MSSGDVTRARANSAVRAPARRLRGLGMERMSSPVRFGSNAKAATLSEKELSSLRVADEDGVHFPFAGVAPPPASPLSPSPAATPRVPLRPGRGGSDPSVPPVSQRSLDSPLGLACRPRSPWGRFDPYDSPEDRDKEYVGFATLPNQVHRKAAKKGFTFTLMVAGESGLGKSTLIDSLFLADLYKDRKIPAAEERIRQTVSTVKRTVSIEEKGVKLRLSVVDTPGFGDAVDNTRSWKHLEDYVERQFDQFFRDESGLDRRNIRDNRVHCCLYFISPHGHGLRPLDVECLRALHDKVNVVPVLAKADSLTQVEVRRKKSKVREELRRFGINIYPFAGCDSDDDDDFKRRDRLLKDSVPFAVIGSGVLAESRGRRVKGRTYPWGVAEVESPAHSDFLLLRDMLVRTHMQDLKDVTRESHYENYRACCIRNMTRMVARDPERSLRAKCGEESDADVPLPLAAFDADKDRLTSEKDQERSSTWWSRRRAAAQHKAPFAIRRARKSAIGIASQSSSYTGLRNAEAEEEYSATGREPQKTKGLFAFCFLLLASFSVQRSKNGKSLCCFAFAQCAVTVIKRLGVFARTKAQKHKSMPLQPRSCQQQTCDVSHVCSQSKYVFFFPSSNCPDATKWQKALIELLDSRQRSSSAPGWRQSNTFIFDRALA
ncbi:septin-5-like isoform X2 [Phyllopteryx taeniolatus]|uniref:septin-5-like isoform X2 n=1 Tax=Phyllopteryx taeniolatus TaxID=161469 RepID=UPI002AD37F1E|nr:septin-5-like isoform X2 [Phyllopteryx taeniolatus]